MLITDTVLDGIVTGRIDTLFRRQKRPTVKAGGTLRTPRGVLAILDVTAIDRADITSDDARRAGLGSVAEVVASLDQRPDGSDYRIRVRPGGEDPRVSLRDQDDLTDDDVASIAARLDRLDRFGRDGPWTRATLRLIADRPHVRAPELAASVGRETAPFKNDVRKLKELGLTISHSPGYELSPRGRVVLDRLTSVP